MIVYFYFPTMMLIAVACLILGWVLGFRQGRKTPTASSRSRER